MSQNRDYSREFQGWIEFFPQPTPENNWKGSRKNKPTPTRIVISGNVGTHHWSVGWFLLSLFWRGCSVHKVPPSWETDSGKPGVEGHATHEPMQSPFQKETSMSDWCETSHSRDQCAKVCFCFIHNSVYEKLILGKWLPLSISRSVWASFRYPRVILVACPW